jgi:mono/diheme cytochrome c family protein
MFRFTFTLTCLLLAQIAVTAQTTPDSSLLTNSTFQKNCAKCHGKTAEGRHFGGPSLVSTNVNQASNDDLLSVITNGKGHMPKYSGKLSAEEISTLVRQIKSLNKK